LVYRICVGTRGKVILSKSDLKALTGYVRVSAQIRWLRKHGWRFVVNGLGDPIVAVAEFNRHLVGGRVPRAAQEVNLEGIND
jgi:Domain of unknown function (DUF4224)